MLNLSYLTDRTRWHLHVQDFDEELDAVLAMHRYLVRASRRDFRAEYERQLAIHNPENYDGGDAIWDAEIAIGVNSWDVESHAGLMAIARAVSIAEVMFARMAAHFLRDPEIWVFPNEGLWMRDWESKFYKFVLVAPFDVGGNGFGPLRELRDLYTHGYGVPATKARLDRLAQRLHDKFDTSPATAEEKSDGFEGEVYFFGDRTTYSSKTRTLESTLFDSHHADVSELATYRALEQLRAHVHSAHAAATAGLRDDVEDGNKYVKTVTQWWAKRTPNGQSAKVTDHEGA